MTEKRFTIEPTMIHECIVDNTTGEQLDTFDYTERLCEVLNNFADENEQLRKELDAFKPVMFQDMRKGTVILYSKDGVEE